MSNSGQWHVRIAPAVQKYIRGTPTEINDAYFKAVDGVLEIADMYTKHGLALCQEGFLYPVRDQGTALHCVTVGHRNEIHIANIIDENNNILTP